MKRQFIQTADGSTSIYLEEMNEHYHSKHGAIVESEHIFVKSGLLAKSDLTPIRVFEVGMGTGLNVLTSLKATLERGIIVNYHAVEAYPIVEEELVYINYPSLLGVEESTFRKIHSSEWEKKIDLNRDFSLTKYKCKLNELMLNENNFDVIYFDAFAPEKQAEMWTVELFSKLFNALDKDGVLVTYCVKGEVRRKLQSVGFTVEKLKGPEGGKREMCRAWKRV